MAIFILLAVPKKRGNPVSTPRRLTATFCCSGFASFFAAHIKTHIQGATATHSDHHQHIPIHPTEPAATFMYHQGKHMCLMHVTVCDTCVQCFDGGSIT